MANFSIRISNRRLTHQQFAGTKKRLQNLCRFGESSNGQILYLPCKSDTRSVYSVDCGAQVSELHAFLLALDFYLGTDRSGVAIDIERSA